MWEECCAQIITITSQLFLPFFAARASVLPGIPQVDASQLCSQHRKEQDLWKRLVWKAEGESSSLPTLEAWSRRVSGYEGTGSPYHPSPQSSPVIPQPESRTEPWLPHQREKESRGRINPGFPQHFAQDLLVSSCTENRSLTWIVSY